MQSTVVLHTVRSNVIALAPTPTPSAYKQPVSCPSLMNILYETLIWRVVSAVSPASCYPIARRATHVVEPEQTLFPTMPLSIYASLQFFKLKSRERERERERERAGMRLWLAHLLLVNKYIAVLLTLY